MGRAAAAFGVGCADILSYEAIVRDALGGSRGGRGTVREDTHTGHAPTRTVLIDL